MTKNLSTSETPNRTRSKRVRLASIQIALASLMLVVLAACGGGSAPSAGGGDDAVKSELERSQEVVATAVGTYPDAAEIVLDPTISQSTYAYSIAKVPFEPSDAVEKISGAIKITDGNYEIEAIAAESGKTFVINQDGEITEE